MHNAPPWGRGMISNEQRKMKKRLRLQKYKFAEHIKTTMLKKAIQSLNQLMGHGLADDMLEIKFATIMAYIVPLDYTRLSN